jgi:chromosomal replication initiator protein
MEIWNKVLGLIQETVNPQSFTTWFAPIKFISLQKNVLTLEAKSSFFSDWIKQNYSDLIKAKTELVTGSPVSVVISEQEAAGTEGIAQPLSYAHDSYKPDYLNERYVFKNFVIGSSNQFAYSAAKAVSEAPGKTKFNPLLIYGGAGLGKTHLVQAIGHHALFENARARVYYTTSEQFTFDFIESIKNNKITELSNFYRNADVLLMDDIQFFIGKERTQEEFFHIFNTLYQNQKQIVLTSDRSPKELQGLEERLVSRFQWGLFVDIQPPDKETRIAIIRKKTESDGIHIPDEVVEFIADNISSNIRELEGSIIKLIAFSSLTKKDISIDLAKEILTANFKSIKKRIPVDSIIESVSKYYLVPENAIRGKGRSKDIVLPRMVSMYLTKHLTDYSLKTIGLQFGGRDHSTVIHAINTVDERMKAESAFNEEISSIKRKLVNS